MFSIRRFCTMPAMQSHAHEVEKFVSSAMTKKGLGEYIQPTMKALQAASIVNTQLLFNLKENDWKQTGVSLGVMRALQEEIAQSTRDKVYNQECKRSKMRREKSLREKRGL